MLHAPFMLRSSAVRCDPRACPIGALARPPFKVTLDQNSAAFRAEKHI